MSPAAMVPQTGLKGAGVLVPVVGPSGAGKDSLIKVARDTFAGNPWVLFPQRIVTRNADPALEAHGTASASQFEALDAAGAFAVSWRAHGHAYGISSSISDDLAGGHIVVVNVSRRVVGDLRRRYGRVHVIYVTAAPEVLAARLRARGRESDTEIARRIARGGASFRPEPPVTVIDNSGALADGAETFVGVLASYVPSTGAESDDWPESL